MSKAKRLGKKEKREGSILSTGVVVAISIIYILIGLLLVFVPTANLVYLFYAIAGVLMIFGITMIVRYLLTKAYKNIGNYGFSIGICCLLVGICVLMKATVLSGYLVVFIGICVLIGAMIQLQNSIDLRAMENGSWAVFLVISFVFLAFTATCILDLFTIPSKFPHIVFYGLIVEGIATLVGTIFVAITLKVTHHRAEKTRKEEEERTAELERQAEFGRKAEKKYREAMARRAMEQDAMAQGTVADQSSGRIEESNMIQGAQLPPVQESDND